MPKSVIKLIEFSSEVIVSIIRLVYVIRYMHAPSIISGSSDGANLIIWTHVEVEVGIICGVPPILQDCMIREADAMAMTSVPAFPSAGIIIYLRAFQIPQCAHWTP